MNTERLIVFHVYLYTENISLILKRKACLVNIQQCPCVTNYRHRVNRVIVIALSSAYILIMLLYFDEITLPKVVHTLHMTHTDTIKTINIYLC